MVNPFKIGDKKKFSRKVTEKELAEFDSDNVHPVYSTFSISRDAEWVCRLFVLEMKEEDEEGIGTMLTVEHKSPALKGSTVDFTASLEEVNGNEVICSYVASVGDRTIAIGKTGQKILKKQKIEDLFHKIRN